MPQPRRSVAKQQPPQQPPQRGTAAATVSTLALPAGGLAAGSAAAAAATATAKALGAATTLAKPTREAVAAATATILAAFDALFRQRREGFAATARATALRQMPGAPEERVAQLVAQEMRFEIEYQRKARARLERDLPAALKTADPAARAAATSSVMEREKRILGQREQAAAQRVVAALEMDLIRHASPQGAYWQISPLLREHCAKCLAMAGQFWPWEVLDLPDMHLPQHLNCGCRLLTLEEAVAQGLMTVDQIPDTEDAIRRAQALMREAKRITETMAPEDLEQVLDDLRNDRIKVEEARQSARWRPEPEKIAPPRGLSSEDLRLLKRLAVPLSPQEAAAVRRGRTVSLHGEDTFLPEADSVTIKRAGHTYISPPGGTSLYRDGLLMRWDHPDLGGPAAARWEPSEIEPEERPPLIPDYSDVVLKIGEPVAEGSGTSWATAEDGARWLIKTHHGDTDHVAAELLANAVYRLAGAQVPVAGKIVAGGLTALAYPALDGLPATPPIIGPDDQFLTDALLANWDARRLENLLADADGNAIRIGASGAFTYRQGGGAKPYGPLPVEAWTLASPRAGAGWTVGSYGLGRQARNISRVLDGDTIAELFDLAPFADADLAAELREAFIQRVAWLTAFGDGQFELPEPLESDTAFPMLTACLASPTPEQFDALATVISGTAGVQTWLRRTDAPQATPSITSAIRDADALLLNSRTRDDLMLYRAVTLAGQDPEPLVGSFLTDNAYMPCTLSRYAARQDGDAVLALFVPAGARAALVRNLLPRESDDAAVDVLLARGASMLVQSVERVGQHPVINAVVIPS